MIQESRRVSQYYYGGCGQAGARRDVSGGESESLAFGVAARARACGHSQPGGRATVAGYCDRHQCAGRPDSAQAPACVVRWHGRLRVYLVVVTVVKVPAQTAR